MNNSAEILNTNTASVRFRAFVMLLKPRLSMLVAFSSAFGYVLAVNGSVDWFILSMLSIGGFLVSGASVIFNQIIEKDLDAMMNRTKTRPLPLGIISSNEALFFGLIVGIAGLVMLYIYTNPLTVLLSFVSMLLYSFVYTPLKRVGPIAVFVGAIPGALPPLIGWVAYSGDITFEALVIFGIQFIWQFPHFWAIAWVADDDYKRAGFKLLPNGGRKDFNSAVQIMTYTLFLLPLSLLPAKFGITGIDSAIVAIVCGVLFLAQTFKLMIDTSRKSALKIMFGSFIYLPVVQIAFMLDKV
ncbi:heme o synthase [Mangrovivirga sp. M17]|uniref:Protoheme IX farnesyltransferase n=1 Tax=Mangrovivirga halotolerans TaxID=2993936 RepID=A0ABT3RM39_9BACT|nr:heme o synthase [Mangrovivirga halotolerans]MCX2742578.1 heme o synthase [Mangrovivirga halotolerans]